MPQIEPKTMVRVRPPNSAAAIPIDRVLHPRIVLRPIANPDQEIDMTDAFIDLIAAELGKRRGGNAVLDRLEAEAHLQNLLSPGGGETRFI